MKNKKTIFGFLIVILVVVILFSLKKDENKELEEFLYNQESYPENLRIVPNSELHASLISDPEFVRDEVSNPDLILQLIKNDGSLEKEIKIPFPNASSIIYSVDEWRHVYIGGVKPNIRENVLIANIDTGKVEQFYFGSSEPKGRAEEITFSPNGRYLTYIDRIATGAGILYLHDFIYGETLDIARFPEYASFEWELDNVLTYYQDTTKKSLDVNALEIMFQNKDKAFPYHMGGDEKYSIWSSVEFGEPGPAKFKIVNKLDGTILGMFEMSFNYGVTSMPLYMNQDISVPTFAVSEGTSSTRSLHVYNYKTGVNLVSDICHSGEVVLFKNDLFYTDCTPSPEIDEFLQEAHQSNLVRRNLLTQKETILRKSGDLESYHIKSFSPSSANTSGRNELYLIKNSYKILNGNDTLSVENLENRLNIVEHEKVIEI